VVHIYFVFVMHFGGIVPECFSGQSIVPAGAVRAFPFVSAERFRSDFFLMRTPFLGKKSDFWRRILGAFDRRPKEAC
jgi:hypothetical protein